MDFVRKSKGERIQQSNSTSVKDKKIKGKDVPFSMFQSKYQSFSSKGIAALLSINQVNKLRYLFGIVFDITYAQ